MPKSAVPWTPPGIRGSPEVGSLGAKDAAAATVSPAGVLRVHLLLTWGGVSFRAYILHLPSCVLAFVKTDFSFWAALKGK